MLNAPLVSVITLTYNQENLLPQCVESVTAQTVADWEQIIIDDESTDGTSQVLATYSDPRLRAVRQSHEGLDRLPQTYQKALSLCRGQFIGFVDGDDYWSPDQLEALLPAFDDPEVVVAFGRTQLVGDTSTRTMIPSPEFYREFPTGALFNTPIGATTRAMLDPRALTFTFPVSVLIRRAALDRIGGLISYPGLPVMDYPTFLHLTLEGRFQYVDRTMGYWRVHRASTTSRRSLAIKLGVYRFIQEFRQTQSKRLSLTNAEWDALDILWTESLIDSGRAALDSGLWKGARSYFGSLVRDVAILQVRSAAVLGIGASLVHCHMPYKLEWLVRRMSQIV